MESLTEVLESAHNDVKTVIISIFVEVKRKIQSKEEKTDHQGLVGC